MRAHDLQEEDIPMIYYALKSLLDKHKVIHFDRGFEDEDNIVEEVKLTHDDIKEVWHLEVLMHDRGVVAGRHAFGSGMGKHSLAWEIPSGTDRLDITEKNGEWHLHDKNYDR